MQTLNKKKLGIALVGLGKYSTEQLAPSLLQTEHCYLAGIVTGSPDKAEKWKNQYDIPSENIYNYDTFDSIKENKDIDIVYVVLPNTMHAEYSIRAAKAGKHVICEKPMAMNVNECEQMIQACKEANTHLSIGYRLHFDTHNQKVMRLGKENPTGNIISMRAFNGRKIEKGTWRTDRERGGSPLRDMGVYCVQACLYTLGTEPIAVTAKELPKTDLERFEEIEETVNWQMEFADGTVADCWASYSQSMDAFDVVTEKGGFGLKPAFYYEGLEGYSSHAAFEVEANPKKQQALQMDDFALCILTQQTTRVPGEMGMRDVKILTAVFESVKSKQRVSLI